MEHAEGAASAAKRRFARQTSAAPSQDAKVLVVWLERMEDRADLPLEDLLSETLTGAETHAAAPSPKEAFLILVQPLSSGLLKVKMQGPQSK